MRQVGPRHVYAKSGLHAMYFIGRKGWSVCMSRLLLRAQKPLEIKKKEGGAPLDCARCLRAEALQVFENHVGS